MKIGELSQATGVDVETIRYYEKSGLLPAPARLANGYREYGASHLERLAFVRHCRALDLPLAEVQRLLDFVDQPGGDCGDINQLIDGQLARVRARLTSLQALERQLRDVPGLANITSTASLERPEIIVRPDAQQAAERGVTTSTIGETVRIATNGDFDAKMAKLNLDNRQVAIQVRIPDTSRQDLETIANLRVRGRDGLIPLSSVASLTVESGPTQIDRYDRRRYATVSADLGGMPLGQALTLAKALPAIQAMPTSVKLIETGDAEIMAELMGGFGMAIVIGVFCVYCVLVLLFRDFFQPLTILFAIPLSVGGAFVALLVTRGMLSLPSMIGLVMLMGIVTKNSILLVEYAVMGIHQQRLSVFDALVNACHKRVRPIVMTTLAMIAGMLPIALGLGADASFRQPMAIAVIGGLVTSTALSLLVVPVAFTYVDDLERLLQRWFLPWSDSAQAVER